MTPATALSTRRTDAPRGLSPVLAQSAGAALAGFSLTLLLPSLGSSIANIALPSVATAFRASFQEVQWVVLAYLLAVTTLVVGAGRLGDLLGRRRLLLAGIGVFIGGSILCASAASLEMLLAGRAVQGAGAAAMMSLGLAFVGDIVPKDKAGSAMGWLGAMSATGTALGPSLGGVLIAGFGWPSIFAVNVPLGLLALGLAALYLPRDEMGARASRADFDVTGTAVLGLTLAAYALAMTVGRGHFSMVNGGLLASALLGLGIFARVESRASSPLVHVAVWSNPWLRGGLLASGIVAAVVMSTLVVGPFYLAGAFGLSPARVGLLLSVGPLMSALAGVPAGKMVDRYGASSMTRAGLVGMALGAAMLSLMPVRVGVLGYAASLVVLTISYAQFQAANNTAVMAVVGSDKRGAMSGMLSLSRNLGLITGASILGAVFAAAAGSGQGLPQGATDVVTGMRVTFAVAGSLVVAALGIIRRSQPGVRETRTPAAAGPRPEWLVPVLLILLSLVPSFFGTLRLAELTTSERVTPANARFFSAPLPVVLHIVSVVPYSIVGAFQFAAGFRKRNRPWHRAAGRILGVLGLVAAFSGLWMAHFYAWPEGDGVALYVLRLVFGTAMAVAILAGVTAARRRDLGAHEAWMTRAYAIGLGAGTQVLTHLPWFALVGAPSESVRAVLMGAGWVINLAVAEWAIRSRRPAQRAEGSEIGHGAIPVSAWATGVRTEGHRIGSDSWKDRGGGSGASRWASRSWGACSACGPTPRDAASGSTRPCSPATSSFDPSRISSSRSGTPSSRRSGGYGRSRR